VVLDTHYAGLLADSGACLAHHGPVRRGTHSPTPCWIAGCLQLGACLLKRCLPHSLSPPTTSGSMQTRCLAMSLCDHNERDQHVCTGLWPVEARSLEFWLPKKGREDIFSHFFFQQLIPSWGHSCLLGDSSSFSARGKVA
jgi:hypothetical protein